MKIQKEIEDPIHDPTLEELKERLEREHEENKKRARWEKWKRILGLEIFFKK